MAFKHGIYILEEPTPIVPPVRVDAAMPVAFITAPVHLSEDPYGVTNDPRLCFQNSEAVRQFGFSLRPEIWDNYTGPQMIFSQFSLFGVAPIVLVNVLDPKIHNDVVANKKQNLQGFSAILSTQDADEGGSLLNTWTPVEGVLIDTVTVRSAAAVVYEAGVHYTLSFNRDGHIVINAKEGVPGGISENEQLEFGYTKLAPEKVDIYDIIGGYDMQLDKNMGLEITEDIFPRFRMVPGQLLAPKYSADPVVAAVMETKGANINGHFRCIVLNDMPTTTKNASGEPVRLKYTDIPAFKNDNNFVFPRQLNGYPKLRLGNQTFYYSVQLAGLIGRTDHESGDIPYNSPSNKNLRINGLCDELGDEMVLNTMMANFLNSQGIITATNFTMGWTAWGNQTGAFPGNTDVKDAMIPVRRMFDWIGNTIVLTYWRKIDFPLTPRRVTTIIDSINMWFNGLQAREFILGGRVDPLQENDNPLTDLLSGLVRFRVQIAPPPPFQAGEFILQYDPEYLQTLFA